MKEPEDETVLVNPWWEKTRGHAFQSSEMDEEALHAEEAWLKYEDICDDDRITDMRSIMKVLMKSNCTESDWRSIDVGPTMKELYDCEHLMQYMTDIETKLPDVSVCDSTFVIKSWQCLTRYFQNIELVSKTLSNILSITKTVSRCNAKDSPVDISVYLGAILSMGLDKTDNKDFEDCFKKLIDILSEVSSSYEKKSKSFWTNMDYNCPYSADMLAALIILLPKIVNHFEYPGEQFDDLTVFFRKFLKDVSENCNSPSQTSIINHLKQGFTEKLLKLIKDLSHNKHCPQSFEGLLDCDLFLLKIDDNPEEYCSILPDLFFFLSKKDTALTTGEGVPYKRVVLVIENLIETSINDCSKPKFALYDESLDYLLQAISANEEICDHLASMIVDLIKALRSSICNDDCESKQLLNSRLQELATKIEPLIDIRNKKTCLSYSRLYCFSISSRFHNNRKTESSSVWFTNGDVMMFFTLMKITISMLNSDSKDLNPHGDPLLKQLVNPPFLSVTQLEEELSNSTSSLTEIVTNNFPELVSQFLEPYSTDYLLLVTKILVKVMDKVDDFHETRWEQVRSILSSFYKNFSGYDHYIIIRSTRLVFMWKLFQMDLNNAFVTSLIMYDCKDDEADKISITGINALSSKEIKCKVQGKFFATIVRDLKQLLLEYGHNLDSFEDSKTCLEEITSVLAEMGQRYLEENHRVMLKELVHVAIDISYVHSECNRVISENIDSFIQNIYLA